MPSPTLKRVVMGNPPLNILRLFAKYGAGAWLEPRIGYMWQSSAGAPKVSTGGQSVGLVTDKSTPYGFGSELIINSDFSGGTTSWSVVGTATLAASSGILSITAACNGTNGARQVITGLTIGDLYYLETRIGGIVGATGPSVRYANGDVTAGWTALYGTSTADFGVGYNIIRPTNTTITISLLNGGDGGVQTLQYDYVSLRKLTNNAASQATAANCPLYQLDAKSLPYLAHDSTDSLSVALPDLGGGVYSASGSIYYATPQGMSALHGQNIGTAHTLPAINTSIYGWCVFPTRLAPTEETQLQLYFEQLAGLRA